MIKKLQVTFLLTFGHCGIDWLHSLLTSNPRILIMPALSFFRIWRHLDLELVEDTNIIFQRLKYYFENIIGPNIKNKQKKLFNNSSDLKKFIGLLEENIKKINNKKSLKYEIFYAIYYCYAVTKNINIKECNVIVSHEHMPWPFEEILNVFANTKILMIIRDPRASFAGFFHGIRKKFGILPEYTFNQEFESWVHGYQMVRKYKNKLNNKLKVVRNESMHLDLEKEMKSVSKWLGVDYNSKMLIGTFEDKTNALPDTQYVDPSIKNFNYDNFYLPENIRSRWLKEFEGSNYILIIETLLNNLMLDFNYDRIYQNKFKIRFKGYLLFFIPNNEFLMKWKKDYPSIEEFKKIELHLNKKNLYIIYLMWKMLPNKVKYFLVFIR